MKTLQFEIYTREVFLTFEVKCKNANVDSNIARLMGIPNVRAINVK